ncbi:MAG: phosphate ABC transporter permease subunit PstC [Candidatus Anstonellaceae archaeon]
MVAISKNTRLEWAAKRAVMLIAFASVLAVALIFLFLFSEGLKLLQFESLSEMLFGADWQPTSANPRFGMLALLSGSILVTAGALFLAIPLGLGCAVYLSELASPKISEILKPTIEIIAGIPSVVLGFFALVVISPAISQVFGLPSGLNALNGALVLALMVVPTIETISEDALRAVPKGFREASLAMGATKWETIWHVTLPSALPGIAVAVLLGFGRAIGETMVVLMATGNAAVIPTGFFDPVRTMTGTIAAEMGEVAIGSAHYQALFMIACLLFLISFTVNIAANIFIKRQRFA